MHDRRGRLGWLAVLGLYWSVQLVYLLSPIDLIPEVVPVFGFADDLLTLVLSLMVTGVSVWRTLPDGSRILEVSQSYEPLTDEELEALSEMRSEPR